MRGREPAARKPNPALVTYLRDHLGGAAAGVEIARRLSKAYVGTPSESAFREPHGIEADREVLVDLLEREGSTRSHAKEAIGWTAEKVSRLKLRTPGRRHTLNRLMELETLGLGIAGKLALWRALEASLETDSSGLLDLPLLAFRAQRQHAFVERQRLDEARRTL